MILMTNNFGSNYLVRDWKFMKKGPLSWAPQGAS